MNDLLVSVVIPTYGRTSYVEEAIKSVINQTYRNIELIVCDDNANKPDVRAEIETIVSRHPGCILLENPQNLGGALNRNEGIKASHGELISFLDDDDVYMPTRIERMVSLYKDNMDKKTGIIYSFAYYTDSDLRITATTNNYPTNNPLYKHMCNCLCPTSQWMIPKNVFNEVGMFEQSPCKQDSIMLLKILGAGYGVLYIDEPLSYFRMHDVKMSRNAIIHIEGEKTLLKYMRNYYVKLTARQIRHVEAKSASRLLRVYSSLHDRKNAFSEFRNIIRNDGLKSVTPRDLLYLFFTPETLRSLKKRTRKSLKRKK